MKKGFSLIELSVVIVIIGLLVGVLIAARSIRNTAQIQAVISDFGKYKTAAIQYKEKYYYWPGDDPNAGNVWQVIAAYGTFVGNGNGVIGAVSGCHNARCLSSSSDTSAESEEATLAIQELVSAGFITANYGSGVGSAYLKAPIDIISGGNLQKPAYYYLGQTFDSTPKNAINISDLFTTRGLPMCHGCPQSSEIDPDGAIKPSDAYAIDQKIDDGSPSTGYIRGLDGTNTTCLAGNGTSATYDINNDATDGCISSFIME